MIQNDLIHHNVAALDRFRHYANFLSDVELQIILQNTLPSVGKDKDDWFRIEIINIILELREHRDAHKKCRTN